MGQISKICGLHKLQVNNNSDWHIYGQLTTIVGVYAINKNALYSDNVSFFNKLGGHLGEHPGTKWIICYSEFNNQAADRNTNMVGRFGEEQISDNGYKLSDIQREYEYVVTNTFFFNIQKLHMYTLEHLQRNMRSLTDLMLVSLKNRQFIVQNVLV